jgi:hypothetical protein
MSESLLTTLRASGRLCNDITSSSSPYSNVCTIGRWPPDPAQRVAARPKRGQHWPGCVSGPFANRDQGSGTGQYRGDHHGQHRAECVPSATAVAWVGDLAR